MTPADGHARADAPGVPAFPVSGAAGRPVGERLNDPPSASRSPASAYAWFALVVLLVANVLNSVDRYIVAILGQAIKHDLAITDAQLGFLLGTAFAVFYAIIGISIGRLADAISRPRLMAIGLVIWSTMTALGGGAFNLTTLGLARMGVGVGEATGTPCSQALIAEYFPGRNRALALGVLLVGSFAGSALALIVGGWILQHWPILCTLVPIGGACGLPGWKATLIAVGLPGIPLALVVAMLRQPAPVHRPEGSIMALALRELSASLPPLALVALYQSGGRRAVVGNLALAAIIGALAVLLCRLTGDVAQWSATGLGAYAIMSWGQVQKRRDLPFYRLTFGCRTFTLTVLGTALVAAVGGAVSAWAPPYAMRHLGFRPAEAGVSLGLAYACFAALGVVFGGWLTDCWRVRDVRAPVWMTMISLFGAMPPLVVMLEAHGRTQFLFGYALFGFLGSLWSGAVAALVQDLVLGRMRASASAAFSLSTIVISAGLGPYWIGKISTITGSLRTGLISVEAVAPFAVVLLLLAANRLRGESPAGRRARAEQFGEAAHPA